MQMYDVWLKTSITFYRLFLMAVPTATPAAGATLGAAAAAAAARALAMAQTSSFVCHRKVRRQQKKKASSLGKIVLNALHVLFNGCDQRHGLLLVRR